MKRIFLIFFNLSFCLGFCGGLEASEPSWLRQEEVDRTLQKENIFQIHEGRHRVAKNLIFPKDKEVRIDPGASFEIESGVSMFFYGRLSAVGTAVKPILFVAGGPKTKWGSLVLSGLGTKGSEIRYAVFRGGSQVETYLGALSLFDTEALISDVLFEGNHSNAFHANQSKVELHGCVFADNLDDGIDWSKSSGIIESNLILRCRTDGIDLKTSDAKILKNSIVDSGGSGMELQERTGAWVERNIIYGSGGDALKILDDSKVELLSNFIVDNAKGVRLFIRKPQSFKVSGDVTGMASTFFSGNRKDIEKDDTAKIEP